MAYFNDGTPMYSKFNGVAENPLGTLEARFQLIKPVKRSENGRAARLVTEDTYNARELSALIVELDGEGRDTKMLKSALATLQKARQRRGAALGLNAG